MRKQQDLPSFVQDLLATIGILGLRARGHSRAVARLPAALSLETSLVSRMMPPYVQAITLDLHHRRARRSLRIRASQPLCSAMDGRGQWYRYHDLFREVLRAVFTPHSQSRCLLHIRAARWYETQAEWRGSRRARAGRARLSLGGIPHGAGRSGSSALRRSKHRRELGSYVA